MRTNLFIAIIAMSVLQLCFTSCEDTSPVDLGDASAGSKVTELKSINETPAFQSEFQGTTAVVAWTTSKDEITGSSSLPYSNWVTDLEGHKYFTHAYLNYEAGTSVQRKADVIADPTPGAITGSKVLRFRIKEPFILNSNPIKARIQLDLENRTKLPRATEYRQVIRMYLAGFDVLSSSTSTFPGPYDWLTLFEFWNDPIWDSYNTARIGINLTRKNKTGPLYFILINENMKNDPRTNIWPADIRDIYAVPANKWMTITLYFKEGDANNGRFTMKCKVDGATETTIYDKIGETKFPGVAGNGMSAWNSMKLYCSGDVVNRFKNAGREMIVYWDNLKIYTN